MQTQQTNTKSLSYLINGNFCSIKTSATLIPVALSCDKKINNKPVLLFVILASKYGITTYLNFWVLITSVVSNLSYFDYVNYLTFLTTSFQLQKQKTINVSTQIQNYFLTSFSWAVVTYVISNLSHSDHLNLPVTSDNKLLATKKERPELFLYI